jgi:anti-sigma factor RsiW
MNHDRARRLFGACWDDELTQAEREWLDAHFAACPRCRAEYDALTRSLELTASLPRVEAAPDLVDRVLARARHVTPARDVLVEVPVRWAPAAVVAAAATVVIAALLVVPRAPWRGAPGAPSLPATAQVVPLGGPAQPERMPQGVAPKPAPAAPSGEVVFDPSKDVEFVLDPVTLHRGRATVTTGSHRSERRSEQAVITF